MNRKSFIKNLIGTAGAITIAPMIEPFSLVPNDKPGIGGEYFSIKMDEGMVWLSGQEYLAQQKFREEIERSYWYSIYTDSKKYVQR